MTRLDGIDVSQLPLALARKVQVDGAGCWIWTGARAPTGHGNAWFGGRFIGAHRLTYLLFVGEIPTGHVVHHECEVPSCVNPIHLVAMSRKQHAAEHGLSGVAAVNAAASVCANGHQFDGQCGRQRTCSTCRREASRRYQVRHRSRA